MIGRTLVMADGLVIDTRLLEGWHLHPLLLDVGARFASPLTVESALPGQPTLFD